MNNDHFNLRDLGIAIIAPAGFVLLQDTVAALSSISTNNRGVGIPSSLISCLIAIVLSIYIYIIYPWIFDHHTEHTHDKDRKIKKSFSFFRGLIIILLLFISGICLQLFSTGILNIIDMYNPELLDSYREMSKASFSPDNGILRVITVMLISPIAEEFIFRGITLHSIWRAFSQNPENNSPVPAIILSSVLFGLYHGNIVQFCYALPAGVLLALLCVWSSSILPGIFLHIVINISSYFVDVLPFALSMTPYITICGITCTVCFIIIYVLLTRSQSHKIS